MIEEAKKPKLTIEKLRKEAKAFAELQSILPEPSLYGVDNGKKIGTHIEKAFKAFLAQKYQVDLGNAAFGVDLPELEVDIKTTKNDNPQSSAPVKSRTQKIFGLGYSLLVFMYAKTDNDETQTAILEIPKVFFIEKEQTADYRLSEELKQLIKKDKSQDAIVQFLLKHKIAINKEDADEIAKEIIKGRPIAKGYLTIPNAFQWRLKYPNVISATKKAKGIWRIK